MASTVSAHRLLATRLGSRALVDVTIAALALACAVAQLSHGGIAPSRPGSGHLDLIAFALAAGSTVPLVVWRRFPLVVFVITASVSVLLTGLGYPIDLAPGPAIALYLLAASRERRTPWARQHSITAGGLFIVYLAAAAPTHGAFPASHLLHTGLAWAGAWFAGERTRLRRDHWAGLRQRADHAEWDAERERLLAVAEERARIARDFHDSAGHAISLIAIRAGAARMRRNPDAFVETLKAIEELARHIAGDIDQLVSTLREDTPVTDDVEAPAGLASLGTLIARHAAAGLSVTLSTVGEPRPLAGAADQAAYRITHEALTNAARHGTGTAAIVVTFGATDLELIVSNPATSDGVPRPGGGHGLVGMHERATLLGGTLDAGLTGGEFRVQATIPYGGDYE